MIKNARRTNQIVEFIDKDHKVANEYYEFIDNDLSPQQLKRNLKRLIDEDPLFFDSYLILADIFYDEGKYNQAKDLLQRAFQKAMMKIVNKEGKWPKIMEWGWVENRHIIRTLDRWATELWDDGKTEDVLTILRNLLKSNPADNIGARYGILAIRMNLDSSYELQFSAILPGYIDAYEISKWFEKNSKKFPEEFDWWRKEIE
ncbi:MAG: hypothetical protein CEE42_13080 [Promethearchaeota archaeon Loki_b31]|nr:MAG: hypothetical protein CEE42_13080 [Candidatus Lokiarchaeota archaeon Loki_b31]